MENQVQNQANTQVQREHWGSKIGLILAMAGNAIGLGNFLRFPCKAAANGGGAFMIPYFIALILLGIPLMWIEWAIGRFGGRHGHGNVPAVFDKIWKNPVSKYIGVLGVVLPLLIVIYYNYIESWTLAYSYFAITGKYEGITDRHAMEAFLDNYTGKSQKQYVKSLNNFNENDTTTEIKLPFEYFFGEGKYIANVKFTDNLNQSHQFNFEFSIYKSPKSDMEIPNKIEPIQLIESTYPKSGDILANQPDNIIIKFKEPIKTSTFNIEIIHKSNYFDGLYVAFIFFIVAFSINIFVLYKGVESGIERLAKIAMPTLFVFAVILAIRVLTLNPVKASVLDGLGFIWNPDLSSLSNASIWLAAAGQIFFTLSICTGAIHAYASFVSDSDDIVLTGLTTAATNEFCEVVLGGSIAIPAAVVFFGMAETAEIAKNGAFNLGFCSMPVIFQQIPLGNLLGAMWFILLFFAGITSSVALAYPAIVFLKDELNYSHKKAVAIIGSILFVSSIPVILFFHQGFLDEMDFWAGTFGLALFGFIELVYFVWIYGMDNAWNEIHLGHKIKVPRIFYYIMKYVTPVFIFILMLTWGIQDGLKILTMEGIAKENIPALWGARILMILIILLFCYFIKKAWDKKGEEKLC